MNRRRGQPRIRARKKKGVKVSAKASRLPNDPYEQMQQMASRNGGAKSSEDMYADDYGRRRFKPLKPYRGKVKKAR